MKIAPQEAAKVPEAAHKNRGICGCGVSPVNRRPEIVSRDLMEAGSHKKLVVYMIAFGLKVLRCSMR